MHLFKKIVPLNTLLISTEKAIGLFCNSTNFFLHCNKHRFCIFFKALGKSVRLNPAAYYLLSFVLHFKHAHLLIFYILNTPKFVHS